MNGSLLILTNENFDKFYYLIVKNQTKNINYEFQETGKVTVITELETDSFDSAKNTNLLEDVQNFFLKQNVLIFETKYYWVAYSHFLRCIKNMILSQKKLPFQNNIINCEHEVAKPNFIDFSTTYHIKLDQEKYSRGTNLILIRDNWNNVDKGSLDDSQFKCLINMLTKQVSVIQGPPGTGKTFVGSMAVKVLTENYDIWNKEQRPILMICKTNHALDQFLNHILKFENKIARIGNRTQDKNLKKYQLPNIRDEFKQKSLEEHSESENEEGYIQNKKEYDIQDQNQMEIEGMKISDSEFTSIRCDLNQLKILFEKKEKENQNLFKLEYSQSYNIKAYAIEKLRESTLLKFADLFQKYYNNLKQYKLELAEDNVRILTHMKTKIVGMTLNGASINSQLIQNLQSPIVIIEEAGEVLESLLIPILQPSTKQLILIGDHQQLKPQINNFDLEKKYKFNTSLLERLFQNQVEHAQLKVQRRMNPEFADYIRLIYDNYQDYPELQNVTNIRGMPMNMYLISHSYSEDIISNSTSKKNQYEAQYAIKLAQYLIKQNQFQEEQITILSMYLGQSQQIRKLARQANLNVRISSVDNYQGEENEIIILSLVRSNQSKNLGYTKSENRINVSFSRAKHGFYCIGNFNMISQVEDAKLWHKIIDLAQKKKHLVESIYFSCTKHDEVTKVTHYNDFDKMPQGGCQKICNTLKKCSHICTQICHPGNCNKYQCKHECSRQIYLCGHSCKQKCYEKCICTQLVDKQLPCGHIQSCPCPNDVNKEQCSTKIEITLQCGHQKSVLCYQKSLNTHKCKIQIDHTYPCSHTQQIKCCDKEKPYQCKEKVEFQCPDCKQAKLIKDCYQSSTNASCTALVSKLLKCNHSQDIQCNIKPENAQCQQPVLKPLLCGHQQLLKCFQEPNKINDCQVQVQKLLKCNHQILVKCCECTDNLICQEIVQKELKCGHQIDTKCSQPIDQFQCTFLVDQQLQCGHQVQNIPCYQIQDGSYKCNQEQSIFMSCGHELQYLCYQKDQNLKCEKVFQIQKNCCGQSISVSCLEYQQQSNVSFKCICSREFIICSHNQNGQRQKELCSQKCRAVLDCGHLCQAQCHECAFGLLHLPCREKITIGYICGHTLMIECNQDPDFCEEQCPIRECSHQKKKEKISKQKCLKKCLEECSFQITESSCKQCDNTNSNQLYCGHKQKQLIEKFTYQYTFNPVKIPQCSIFKEPINTMRFKNELNNIQMNKIQLVNSIQSKIKNIILERKFTIDQVVNLSQKYLVFMNQNSLFDQLRLCYLYESISYIQFIQNKEINIESFDNHTQKILNTIQLQTQILENTYLQQVQKKLGIQHIRKFVNSVIYLTGLLQYYSSPQKVKIPELLDKYQLYKIPFEDEYNLLVYKVFQNDVQLSLQLIERNKWTSPIYQPIQMQVCSNLHIQQLECQVCKICDLETNNQYYSMIKPL
ncbi:hypothetical protein ABPG74_009610 [Tetrahymena malaccensis]